MEGVDSDSSSMSKKEKVSLVETCIGELSGELDKEQRNVFMVMAAGHGKRLHSNLPKVMHLMWGVPSLDRVIMAAEEGLGTKNQVIIVGKKAKEVISHVGKSPGRVFAYQDKLNGTGHAVQIGLESIPKEYEGVLYTLPGDMGLLDAGILASFRRVFEEKQPSMMMLIGLYEGDIEKNYYGRVVCVPEQTEDGSLVNEEDCGRVLAIVQYQDLRAMGSDEELVYEYKGHSYRFRAGDLLASRKFDAGVFAFSLGDLRKHIGKLESNNVQEEIYLTDLVELFRENNLSIESVVESDSDTLLGFNDKTVWRKMESVLRQRHYERLRNIVNIEDESRFYIHEKIIEWMEVTDREDGPLDITIGSGVSLGEDVKLSRGVELGTNVSISGEVELGEDVKVGAGTVISNFPGQRIVMGSGVKLDGHAFIKGCVTLAKGVWISAGVNITGSSDYPTVIGEGATIIGSCYVFGCEIEAGSHIESSILIKNRVRAKRVGGEVAPIKYIIPKPVGWEYISDLNEVQK